MQTDSSTVAVVDVYDMKNYADLRECYLPRPITPLQSYSASSNNCYLLVSNPFWACHKWWWLTTIGDYYYCNFRVNNKIFQLILRQYLPAMMFSISNPELCITFCTVSCSMIWDPQSRLCLTLFHLNPAPFITTAKWQRRLFSTYTWFW